MYLDWGGNQETHRKETLEAQEEHANSSDTPDREKGIHTMLNYERTHLVLLSNVHYSNINQHYID